MAQTRELFFDAETVEGLPDRVYQAADWPAIFGRSFTDGYLDLDEWADPLLVEASDPAAMTVEVNDGAAWLQGRFFEIYDGPQTLTVPEADPANPRIDRVVVRLDLSARTIELAVLEGTPAGSPSAPALTRTDTVWELSLAQLAIAAGATSVASGSITDERDDDAVCGVAESALASGSSVEAFTDLSDTPADYTGHGEKTVTVKADETGLEFTPAPSDVSPLASESTTLGDVTRHTRNDNTDTFGDLLNISGSSGYLLSAVALTAPHSSRTVEFRVRVDGGSTRTFIGINDTDTGTAPARVSLPPIRFATSLRIESRANTSGVGHVAEAWTKLD